ncbi:hypothetical protein JB92DRAFT_3150158, partial [Gautieria morchelliformis]
MTLTKRPSEEGEEEDDDSLWHSRPSAKRAKIEDTVSSSGSGSTSVRRVRAARSVLLRRRSGLATAQPPMTAHDDQARGRALQPVLAKRQRAHTVGFVSSVRAAVEADVPSVLTAALTEDTSPTGQG